MAGTGNSNESILAKFGLQPLTKCSLVKFYIPVYGAASYTALSVNVMNPSLVIRIFPKKDITNLLLGGALLGTGSYIYSREHMKKAPTATRIAYSAAGAILLSFGSVLVWAVLRSVIPPNSGIYTLAGLGTGCALLRVGMSYLDFVDSQIANK